MTTSAETDEAGALRLLAGRVAKGDRSALLALCAALGAEANDRARGALSRADDVTAVVCATFVEVWWLARFHGGANADVREWISGIAARRADDRRRDLAADWPDSYRAVASDDTGQVALGQLLGESGPAARARCAGAA